MLLRPRQILAPVIFATVFGYFGYHLVNGDRGLLAMAHLQRESMIADQNLAEAETTRKIWERACHRAAQPEPRSGHAR